MTLEGAAADGLTLKMRLRPGTRASKVVAAFCKAYEAKRAPRTLPRDALVLECDGVVVAGTEVVAPSTRVAVVRVEDDADLLLPACARRTAFVEGAAAAAAAKRAIQDLCAKAARAERCGDYAGGVYYYEKMLTALRRGAGSGDSGLATLEGEVQRKCLVAFTKAAVYAAELDHERPVDVDPALLRPAFWTKATLGAAARACGDGATARECRARLAASRDAPFPTGRHQRKG